MRCTCAWSSEQQTHGQTDRRTDSRQRWRRAGRRRRRRLAATTGIPTKATASCACVAVRCYRNRYKARAGPRGNATSRSANVEAKGKRSKSCKIYSAKEKQANVLGWPWLWNSHCKSAVKCTLHTYTHKHREWDIESVSLFLVLRSFFHYVFAFYSLCAFSHTHFAQSKSLRFGCHPQLAIVAIV